MRSRTLLLMLMVAAGAAVVACGTSTGQKTLGETCNASTECGPDLVCNFAAMPAVCAANGPLPADAGIPDAFMLPKADAKPGPVDAMPTADAMPTDDAAPDATVDAM
jgi:hypothetical protein